MKRKVLILAVACALLLVVFLFQSGVQIVPEGIFLEMQLTYIDGTVDTTSTNTLIPFAGNVYYEGKQISGVLLTIYGLLTWEENYESLQSNVEVDTFWDSMLKESDARGRETPSGWASDEQPISGEKFRLHDVGAMAETLQNWAYYDYQYHVGDHTLRYEIKASVTIGFPDGSHATRSCSGSATLTLTITEQASTVSSLQLSVENLTT